MSIKEVTDKSNTLKKLGLVQTERVKELPQDEEFEIVSVNGSHIKQHLIAAFLFILIASASYGIGRLSYFHSQKVPIEVKSVDVGNSSIDSSVGEGVGVVSDRVSSKSQVGAVTTSIQTKPAVSQSEGLVVASKNGTKYYFPTCSGAKRILDKNKVFYSSFDEARKAGLTPSSTCKGLK